MTLDEAIIHCEERAKINREIAEVSFGNAYTKDSCRKCAEEHEQLAEWLKDYKRLLEERPQGEWIPIKSLMEDNHHSRISFRCNQCRYVEGYRAKYCAGCGTFMRVEDGGSK